MTSVWQEAARSSEARGLEASDALLMTLEAPLSSTELKPSSLDLQVRSTTLSSRLQRSLQAGL